MTRLLKYLLSALLLLSIYGCKTNTNIKLHIISDTHFAPKDMFSYTGEFKKYCNNNGTGKQIEYQEEIFDIFIDEEINNKPEYLIITGDLVYSGSKEAHNAFKEKFHRLIDNGIRVLVIPGNHDFDYYPFYYQDGVPVYSKMLSKEEFENIYQDFGYNEAFSRDEKTLSYSYKLDAHTLLIALDTQAEYGYTDGNIKGSTLTWIEEQLKYSKKHNMNVVFVGHHNLFIHNPMFDYGYRLNNSKKLIELMNTYNAKLYVSGHMHIQDISSENKITEILNEAYTLYPHRYGELVINGNNYSYEAKATNISSFNDKETNELINYKEFGKDFYYNNFYQQIISRVDNRDNLSKEEKDFYYKEAILNGKYFAGIKDEGNYEDFINSPLASEYIRNTIEYLKKDNLKISGFLK